jgi:3-oxoacyl-[acyl-carrier protein] reductase
MDLGIAGRTALICASSRGLGRACAAALVNEGVHVVINGRDAAQLARTAHELEADAPGRVTMVVGDVTQAEGRAALLAACPHPDILINNNAGPTPLNFMDAAPLDWQTALEGNMIAALSLVRAVLPSMIERRFGRIINVTSAMVTTPRPHMVLSAGARAGLTAVMKALSLEVVQHNVTINNLLPERIDTDRQRRLAERVVLKQSVSYDMARQQQIESVAAKRLGRPEEFGAACAFLCGALSGFISGQNLHLDGGSYPALI